MSNSNYAGFWMRFVAVIIDGLIIGALQFLIITPILGALGLSFASGEGFDFSNLSEDDMAGMATAISAAISAFGTVSFVIRTLYFSLMESSKYQATLGKMALGLKVTDMNGGRLDFVKALIRQVCKIISGMILLIGYIMAGLTEKKQALHDMIAGALVVKK